MITKARMAQVPLTPELARLVDLATEREQRLAGPSRRVVRQRFNAELFERGVRDYLADVAPRAAEAVAS
jgi:hypothetical protein